MLLKFKGVSKSCIHTPIHTHIFPQSNKYYSGVFWMKASPIWTCWNYERYVSVHKREERTLLGRGQFSQDIPAFVLSLFPSVCQLHSSLLQSEFLHGVADVTSSFDLSHHRRKAPPKSFLLLPRIPLKHFLQLQFE